MLGGAIHYQQSPDTRNIADVDRNTLEYTVDVSLEASGWDLYAAFIGRSDDFRSSAGDTGFDDFASSCKAASGSRRSGSRTPGTRRSSSIRTAGSVTTPTTSSPRAWSTTSQATL